MIQEINLFMTKNILPFIILIFGEDSLLSKLVSANPILLLILVLLPIIIIWVLAIFLDFVQDSWKMPFGVIGDVLIIILFPTFPWALIGCAVVGAIIYYFLADGSSIQNYVSSSAFALRALLLIPIIPLPETLKVILVIFPIYTILTFFLCITD